jgi:hypothetical protein
LIRAANTLDLLRLFTRGPQPVLQFDAPQSLIRPRPGLRTGLSQVGHAFLAGSNPSDPVYVYINRGRILAYIRAWADSQSGGQGSSWTLAELGSPRKAPLSEEMVIELLEASCQAAGQYGTMRMFARLPEGAALLDTLSSLSFRPYADETVWAKLSLNDQPAVNSNFPPRPLRRRDSWAVYQLYLTLTPERVQHSEGYSSRRWQANKSRIAWGGNIRRFVWDDGRGVRAYLQMISGPRGHEMKVMSLAASSNDHELTGAVVDYALGLLHGRGERAPLYCTVRDYQSGLSEALEGRGFRPMLRQKALVKHLAAFVRQAAPALRPTWSNPLPADAVPAAPGGLVMNTEPRRCAQ